MKQRGNSYRQGLERRLQEAKQWAAPAPEPKPDLVAGFSDPAIREELLADQISEARAALAAERERRQQAERRASQVEADKASAEPSSALADLINKRRVRRAWK